MIKLVVAPYCDDCMHFKPKAKTTCQYTLDNLCTSVMTVVECENAGKCEEISKTIAKRYGITKGEQNA